MAIQILRPDSKYNQHSICYTRIFRSLSQGDVLLRQNYTPLYGNIGDLLKEGEGTHGKKHKSSNVGDDAEILLQAIKNDPNFQTNFDSLKYSHNFEKEYKSQKGKDNHRNGHNGLKSGNNLKIKNMKLTSYDLQKEHYPIELGYDVNKLDNSLKHYNVFKNKANELNMDVLFEENFHPSQDSHIHFGKEYYQEECDNCFEEEENSYGHETVVKAQEDDNENLEINNEKQHSEQNSEHFETTNPEEEYENTASQTNHIEETQETVQEKNHVVESGETCTEENRAEKNEGVFTQKPNPLEAADNVQNQNKIVQDINHCQEEAKGLIEDNPFSEIYKELETDDNCERLFNAMAYYNNFEQNCNPFNLNVNLKKFISILKHHNNFQKLLQALSQGDNLKKLFSTLKNDDNIDELFDILKYDNSVENIIYILNYHADTIEGNSLLKRKSLSKKNFKKKLKHILTKVYEHLKKADSLYETEMTKAIAPASISKFKITSYRRKNKKIKKLLKKLLIISPVLSVSVALAIFAALKVIPAIVMSSILAFVITAYVFLKYKKCKRLWKIFKMCKNDKTFKKRFKFETA
ncbi:Pv-fam-d protein [Plasmodium ovale wallikeri]|uniref:Pv-fam-d protein n=1 Tax=Plasmodium ovale wallikeri TaxID=864142 RepID=A0A1A9A3J1_PLAOA|nr:Pv-fam-d protein [Plasmodium ovale wallikeri]